MERELTGGELHVYEIALVAGDFLHLVVTQRGIDVAVVLHDPDGRELLAMDGPNGPDGPEPLAVVATSSGVHRLEVRAPAERGRYRLEVRTLGPPDEQDRTHAAGMRLWAEAEALRKKPDPGSRRQALDLYRQALDCFQSVDAPLLAARSLRRIAQVLYDLGEIEDAAEHFERALADYRTVGNAWEVGSLLNQAGSAWRLVGEPQRAREHFERALERSRSVANRLGTATALNNLGVLHDSLGELQEALRFYDLALAVWRELGVQGREGTTLHNVGISYLSLGRVEEGLDFLRQALAIRRQTEDRAGQAVTWTAVGWARSLDGDFAGALEAYEEALPLRRAVGDRQGEAVTLDLRGTAWRELGEHDKALVSYRQALAIIGDSENRYNEAHTVANVGRVHALRGAAETALAHYDHALQLFRQLGDRNGEASVLVAIARAERQRGNLAVARDRLEAALGLVESVRSRLQSGALRRSYLATRHDDYGAYVDLLIELDAAEPGRGHDGHALEASERARARGLLESLAEARAGIRQRAAPEILDRERALRARINAKEGRRLRLLSEDGAEERAAAVEAELRSLLLEYEKVQGEIRAASPEGVLSEPRPLTLEEIREEVLDDETLLLAWWLGEERSFLWVVGRESLTSHVLPARQEVDGLARKVCDLLPRSHERGLRRQAAMATAALSDMVLAPAAAELSTKRLLILADGALQYVPFAALPVPGGDGGVPLLAEHEVVVLPSASVLAQLRRSRVGRRPAPEILAVVADPVFHPADPRLSGGPAAASEPPADLQRAMGDLGIERFDRLPYSGEEAAAILALVPASRSFRALGFAASRETVLSGELGRYRMVHFATHGLLNARHPPLSGIVLSLVDETGAPRDGFLRVHEVLDLSLPADLVVLSACRTALGKEVRGEGLMGLTRGFFYAGAARVVVSYWNVSDQATAELMARFYRGMLGDGLAPAQALRTAQLSMLGDQRWQAAYYWAGFALQGEWR